MARKACQHGKIHVNTLSAPPLRHASYRTIHFRLCGLSLSRSPAAHQKVLHQAALLPTHAAHAYAGLLAALVAHHHIRRSCTKRLVAPASLSLSHATASRARISSLFSHERHAYGGGHQVRRCDTLRQSRQRRVGREERRRRAVVARRRARIHRGTSYVGRATTRCGRGQRVARQVARAAWR